MNQVEGNFLTEYLTADKLDQSLTHLIVSWVVPITDLNKAYTSQSLCFTLQVEKNIVYT